MPRSLSALSTIASPFFCEFSPETYAVPLQIDSPPSVYWDNWEEINQFLEERFATSVDSKIIITTGELYDREVFRRHAEEIFPLWASRGCIHIETPYFIDRRRY